MLFHFILDALAEVRPWGDPPSTIHWFGLTAGWYWMQVGDNALFRYTDAAQAYWSAEDGAAWRWPYADYFVVRFWEDLLEILPLVLNPLPDPLIACIHPADQWRDWLQRSEAWMLEQSDDKDTETAGALDRAAWNLLYRATGWWGAREINTGPLNYGPHVWFWREDTTVHIRWDNTDERLDDGTHVWTATRGEYTLPLEQFLAEVQSFNDRLMDGMAERIAAAPAHWAATEILIDLADLEAEHSKRTAALAKALSDARPPLLDDWAAVRQALSAIDAALPRSRGK